MFPILEYILVNLIDTLAFPITGCGTRHVFAILAYLGFINIYALRISLSVALVAMVNSTKSQSENSSAADECPEHASNANSTRTLHIHKVGFLKHIYIDYCNFIT